MEAIAIQIVSNAILFPAQALATEVCPSIPHQLWHTNGASDVPTPKSKDTAICRVRQAIVDEALGLELLRFYEDSLVVEYGPKKQRLGRETLLQRPSITHHVFPSTDAPAGM